MMSTVLKLGADLAGGRTTSRALVEQCLTKIAEPQARSVVFVKVYEDMACAEAETLRPTPQGGRRSLADRGPSDREGPL